MSITGLASEVTLQSAGGSAVQISGDATLSLSVKVEEINNGTTIRMQGHAAVQQFHGAAKKRITISASGVRKPDFTGVNFRKAVVVTVPNELGLTESFNTVCTAQPSVGGDHRDGTATWSVTFEEY